MVLVFVAVAVFWTVAERSMGYSRCERFYRNTRSITAISPSKPTVVHIVTFGDGMYLEQAKDFARYLKKTFVGNDRKQFKIHRFDMSMISAEFKEKNKTILDCNIGFGYWLWKPYICNVVFDTMGQGDVLWYIDGGLTFKNDHVPATFLDHVDWCTESKSGGLGIEQDTPQGQFCKRDVFAHLNMDYDSQAPLMQYAGGFFYVQRREGTMFFFKEWLECAVTPGMIDNSPSRISSQNALDVQVKHRHDQAIFSLLAHKYSFDVIPASNENEWPFYRKRPTGHGLRSLLGKFFKR